MEKMRDKMPERTRRREGRRKENMVGEMREI